MTNFISSHFRRSNEAIKQSNAWDIGLLKIACLFGGLLLAKVVPDVLAAPLWFYLAVFVILALVVAVRILPKYAAASGK